ncbi:MAG: GNAT family N-acetyltransferase [Cyanobacteriota bacterium]
MTKELANVEVRPARAEDKEAVLAFCQHTWENKEDYIHLVWNKWITDPTGRLFVAVVNGLPVAMERVVLMSEHEAWWEGLRIDPRYRGQGLVGVLRPHLEQYLQEAGISISRTCISSENRIMQGIMARRDRKRVGRYTSYKADSIDSPLTQLVQLTDDDFDAAWKRVISKNFFTGEQCLYIQRGAKWQELTTQQLSDRIEAGLVWGLKQGTQVLSLAIQSYLEGSNQMLWVGYANGTAESLPILLHELRLLAHHQEYLAISGIFPLCDFVIESLNIAGYERTEEQEYWVYEWSLVPAVCEG